MEENFRQVNVFKANCLIILLRKGQEFERESFLILFMILFNNFERSLEILTTNIRSLILLVFMRVIKLQFLKWISIFEYRGRLSQGPKKQVFKRWTNFISIYRGYSLIKYPLIEDRVYHNFTVSILRINLFHYSTIKRF